MLCGWVGHITTKACMPEWSKGVDLRPTIVRCEGSNPSLSINWLCMIVPDKNNIHIYIQQFPTLKYLFKKPKIKA